LKDSKYLKKEDVTPPVTATISKVSGPVNIGGEGAKKMRYMLHFEELDKPMVLNSTNGQLIAQITGSDETDDWIGKRVTLYNDPNVSYGGKLLGGIRVRAPKPKGSAAEIETDPEEGDPDW